MKKRYWWAIAALAGVAVGAGWCVKTRGPKPTPVQLAKVGKQDLQAKVTANGKVQAQKKVDISATVMGQVTRLAVKEGDRVTRGQFLLEIDPANPRALARSSESSMEALRKDLDSAKASLEQAKYDHSKAEANYREGIIAAAEFERATTNLDTARAAVAAAEHRVEQARAMLEGARDQLSKTTVRSPMDGVVTAKRIEEGEVAVIGIQNSPGTVLLTISDMSVVETEMEVDETSIPTVAVGQQALVRVDAYQNQSFHGIVTDVGSSPLVKTGATADQAIKFKVKIQIKDPPPDIKPGLSVQADILTGFRADALAAPIQALVVRDAPRSDAEKKSGAAPREEEGVYLVESGKVKFQPIKTGLVGELSIEVLEGLKGGETIVAGPFQALRTLQPGAAVTEEKKPDRATGSSPDAAGR